MTTKDKSFFIGRENEQALLMKRLASEETTILILYGRRRIGKTALIEKCLGKKRFLKLEGVQGQDEVSQIQYSLLELSKFVKDPLVAKLDIKNWYTFFDLVADYVEKKPFTIYLEEIQWLASYNSRLISELKPIWDNRLSKITGQLLIICGSATSFIVTEVIQSQALYNRSQYTLQLEQFSLAETAQFFPNKTRLEVLDAYLTVGGIPEYLKYLKDDSSIFLSLVKESFGKNGYFKNEIDKIFVSALAQNVHYRAIIDFLSQRKYATREEIAKALGIKAGGDLSKILNDLSIAEFVTSYAPFTAKEDSKLLRYTIRDNYLCFYYYFIKPLLPRIERGEFNARSAHALSVQDYIQWLGYRLEHYCLNNAHRIAKTLGFSDISYRCGTYYKRDTPKMQIDLLYDRKDRVLSVCEIKYSRDLSPTKLAREFSEKLAILKSDKTIQKVLIAPLIEDREKFYGFFDRVLTLEDLFTPWP